MSDNDVTVEFLELLLRERDAEIARLNGTGKQPAPITCSRCSGGRLLGSCPNCTAVWRLCDACGKTTRNETISNVTGETCNVYCDECTPDSRPRDEGVDVLQGRLTFVRGLNEGLIVRLAEVYKELDAALALLSARNTTIREMGAALAREQELHRDACQRVALRDARVAVMESVLHECDEYLEQREDVLDGAYGEPAPNKEMLLRAAVLAALADEKAGGEGK